MEIRTGSPEKSFTIAALSAASAANKFPDVLFFAGGISYQEGLKPKVRIAVSFEGGPRIKTWEQEVTYLLADAPYGHMFDGALVKSDDLANKNIAIKAEIDVGRGYEELSPVDSQECGPGASVPGKPHVNSLALSFANAAQTAGCIVGLMLTF